MSFSDNLENDILNALLGRAGVNPGQLALAVDPLYIGLSNTTPADNGTNFTEPSNGYARVSFANNTTNWPTTSTGQKKNANAITFPAATGTWGTITYFGIFTASSGGVPILTGALTASKTPAVGDTLTFPTNGLTVTLD